MTRSLKPVTRVTIGEQVALQLAAMISDGRWMVGQRLPSEGELCQQLGIGRSTLREALKSLAFIGMVRMRPGDGTYVTEQSSGLMDRILARGLLKTEKDLADVCETRLVLETELAAMAADRAEAADLALLEDLLEQSKCSLAGEGRPFIELDLEFHLAIASCSKNKVLRQLLSDIRGVLMEWITKSQELPGLRENALVQHVSIFEAIRDRDEVRARVAMRMHLETFLRAYNLLGRIASFDGIRERTPALAEGNSSHS
jgi:GntR family transcriptional regulator, transcriptional repressor for pyruvate dehydrogenase complex